MKVKYLINFIAWTIFFTFFYYYDKNGGIIFPKNEDATYLNITITFVFIIGIIWFIVNVVFMTYEIVSSRKYDEFMNKKITFKNEKKS